MGKVNFYFMGVYLSFKRFDILDQERQIPISSSKIDCARKELLCLRLNDVAGILVILRNNGLNELEKLGVEEQCICEYGWICIWGF